AILATEPDHEPIDVEFARIPPDTRRFTLLRFLATHRWPLAGSFVFIVIETLTTQSGPWLQGRGIDAIVSHNVHALARIALLFAAAVVLSLTAGRVRLAWTGRVGERMMLDLRIRIFSHLQRLGVAYYTKEIAGRL